ncbi:uncharacterized protein BKA55DRAFT_41468 [Fusarium redolens]|uniref:Uncharacterized protein n=1 Tax=Fusarium redolens TaxID=48865 RepID=A0A9P9R9I1_FUSRE|nr:uncharacterized protein BKA55DRAFT_41468 [Fusarium redolens]KAH7270323.1 hypothetical protein BKA55DRAFT_41468 [Fusarium redolens]
MHSVVLFGFYNLLFSYQFLCILLRISQIDCTCSQIPNNTSQLIILAELPGSSKLSLWVRLRRPFKNSLNPGQQETNKDTAKQRLSAARKIILLVLTDV